MSPLDPISGNSLPDIGSRGDTMSPLILSLYYPNAVLLQPIYMLLYIITYKK